MPVPTWLSAIGHVASDTLSGLFAGVIGARLATGHPAERVGEDVGERIRAELELDRQDLVRWLLELQRENVPVEALIGLLGQINRKRFIRAFGGRYYTEHWLVKMLLKVQPEHRGWIYPTLNTVLERNLDEFIALLETYHNDGYIQFLVVAWDYVSETWRDLDLDDQLGRAVARAMGVATVDEARRRLQDRYDQLQASRRPSSMWWRVLKKGLPW
ncbi:MAG: hypothetical protein Q8R13_00920 [bacterium]|nr:hypothetical protein [bacterium]MDZ4295775.1 hypothetical protein [Patescibacteria group bacterium]